MNWRVFWKTLGMVWGGLGLFLGIIHLAMVVNPWIWLFFPVAITVVGAAAVAWRL